MNDMLLVCRSQTEALKAYRLLESGGIRGYLTRPPREEQNSSCSYAVRVHEIDRAQAIQILQEKNFTPCKVRES